MIKPAIIFILFLISYNLSIAQSELIIGKEIDTILIKGIRLSDIDYRIKLAIDDHFKRLPLIKQLQKGKALISVKIEVYAMKRLPEKEIDSLYKYNSFQTQDFYFPYLIKIDYYKKKDGCLKSLLDYYRYYFYNYNGFETILMTNLKIQFPWVNDSVTKKYTCNSTIQSKYELYYSVYSIDNHEVIRREFIRLFSNPGIPLKRKYLNEYLRQKDLIKTNLNQ